VECVSYLERVCTANNCIINHPVRTGLKLYSYHPNNVILFRTRSTLRYLRATSARTLPGKPRGRAGLHPCGCPRSQRRRHHRRGKDRKSTRLNSSHVSSSYAVFCVKKKNRADAAHSQHDTIIEGLAVDEQ